MNLSINDKIKQEKQYHNRRYKKDPRGKLGTFYQNTKTVREDYRRVIYKDCKGRRGLELGCAAGSCAFEMGSRGAKITAIDISDRAIEKAREKARREKSNIHFQVMNAEKLELQDNYFDLVFGTAILHHLDLNKASKEIKRVLKHNGMAVFVEPLGHNIFINWFRIFTPGLRTKHEHPLKLKDLKYLENRFGYLKVKYYYLFSLFAIPFTRFAPFANLLKALENLDNKIFGLLPFFRRYAWQALIMLKK